MKTYKIAAIAGDGIGKEVTAKDLDRVIVRENSKGEYAGHPWSGFRHHSKGVANPIGAFPFSLSVRVNDCDLLLGIPSALANCSLTLWGGQRRWHWRQREGACSYLQQAVISAKELVRTIRELGGIDILVN